MGRPRAAHISIPTRWFGLSVLDVDKEADGGDRPIFWTATHQLWATKMPRCGGGGLGDCRMNRGKRAERTEKYG